MTSLAGAGTVGSAEQLRRLQAVTDAALSRLGVEDLLRELLERTKNLLRTDTAAVMLLDAAGSELVATAASGLEREVCLGVRVPFGRGFAGTVAARGEPLAVEQAEQAEHTEHTEHTGTVNPMSLGARLVAALGVPMISDGQVIGVLYVGTRAPRRFTGQDIELLQLVADRAAHATVARLHSLDHAAAHALQRSLLPARPPRLPGLDLAVRYVPGAEIGVGGDWYDVFDLPSGYIGIAVGDVAGNGLRAAVVMGRIRSALRAYAMETDDPAEVLTRLDREVQRFEPDAMATAIYAVIGPDLATLTLSNAGHLPPVGIEPGGAGRLTVVKPDLPLGTDLRIARYTTELPLPVGQCMLFYTDGLVERRDRSLTAEIRRLAEALGAGHSAEELCTAAMAAMLDDAAPTDDIAMLALRRTPAGTEV
ncbi:GAF domain-containing SpoIIE family protein phosphatase [Dactylosporangium sp. NPDC051484]|uniref:PP2C family protein-serine/threonine phosphatase n=1 Tax=Dactylosporangium sp. NPDC051484 TaxID=3154942 RepID=UPI00344C6C92